MEGKLILKLGSEVAKHAYQNRQFREISAQNQRLMETVRKYRTLNYVEQFYTGMTLLNEAMRSQSETVFCQNLHSANDHFTQFLCMDRAEGIDNKLYRDMIIASRLGKCQYYAAHNDLPNMMQQFFICGSKYPLTTLNQFGKVFPQLYVNEIFEAYLKSKDWLHDLVNLFHLYLAEQEYEKGLHLLQQELHWMRVSIREKRIPTNLFCQETDFLSNLLYSTIQLEHLYELRKLPLFCEEDITIISLHASDFLYRSKYPEAVCMAALYMQLKTALLHYCHDGLDQLANHC